MENSNNNKECNVQLQIAFPKSNEDHRLQLVAINGSIFAILHSPLESNGPIQLRCAEWSLILLAPIKSQSNIVISAINVICLNKIESEGGVVNLHASNQLVKFAHLIHSPKEVCEIAEGGEFQFNDDPGAFLFYSRLFNNILNGVRVGKSETVLEAQQMFLTSLCALAEKLTPKTKNLDLSQVLAFWHIPFGKI